MTALRRLATVTARFWRMLPFRFHWLLVLLMAFVIPEGMKALRMEKPGEWYPFSNFPMYATFTADTYLVFITDQDDQPLPIKHLLGTAASDVKKTYDRKLAQLKSRGPKGARKLDLPLDLRREAGAETLLAVVKTIPDAAKLPASTTALRLHEVTLSYQEGRIHQGATAVGEIPFPARL
jgi:hypothetical protein